VKLLPGRAWPRCLCLLSGSAAPGGDVRGRAPGPRRAATLGYAVAATAALLLLALPAGVGAGAQHGWLGLALLELLRGACCLAPCSRGLAARRGSRRHRDPARPGGRPGRCMRRAACRAWAGLGLRAAGGIAATVLLTLATRRTRPWTGRRSARRPSALHSPAHAPRRDRPRPGLAGARLPGSMASLWVAPVGITLGLVLFALARRRATGHPPGDLLGPVGAGHRAGCCAGAGACLRFAAVRDRVEAGCSGLVGRRGLVGSDAALDLRLRSWPTTSVLMLLVALGAAYLLAR
jgi:hypothetical protein